MVTIPLAYGRRAIPLSSRRLMVPLLVSFHLAETEGFRRLLDEVRPRWEAVVEWERTRAG